MAIILFAATTCKYFKNNRQLDPEGKYNCSIWNSKSTAHKGLGQYDGSQCIELMNKKINTSILQKGQWRKWTWIVEKVHFSKPLSSQDSEVVQILKLKSTLKSMLNQMESTEERATVTIAEMIKGLFNPRIVSETIEWSDQENDASYEP